jgi:hypothetical protein
MTILGLIVLYMLALVTSFVPASIIGYILFRFSVPSPWCFVAAECMILLYGAFSGASETRGWVNTLNFFNYVPVLLNMFAGYYFGKWLHSPRSN